MIPSNNNIGIIKNNTTNRARERAVDHTALRPSSAHPLADQSCEQAVKEESTKELIPETHLPPPYGAGRPASPAARPGPPGDTH